MANISRTGIGVDGGRTGKVQPSAVGLEVEAISIAAAAGARTDAAGKLDGDLAARDKSADLAAEAALAKSLADAEIAVAAHERLFEATDPKALLEELDLIQRENRPGMKKPETARLLARLAVMAEPLARLGVADSVFKQAIIAARSAAGGVDDPAFAEDIVKALERELSTNAPAQVVFRGLVLSFVLLIALGLLILLVLVATAAANLPNQTAPQVWTALWNNVSTNTVVIGALFGMLGGIVSVLLRIDDFDGVRRSRQFLFSAGAVLPIVGTVFAVIVCAMFSSSIISSNLFPQGTGAAEKIPYFFMVVGFVAGFSERFARGLFEGFQGNPKLRDGGGGGDGKGGQGGDAS